MENMMVEDYGDCGGNEGFGIMVMVMSVMGGKRRFEYEYGGVDVVVV
jgi:hypothetical protein